MHTKTMYTFLGVGAVSLVLALDGQANTGTSIAIEKKGTELNASHAAFQKMMDVLMHQRCMNCHLNDNLTKQTEAKAMRSSWNT